jgi:tRNA (cmo5U34)-methyltransferase
MVSRKSTPDEIRRRFDQDVERFSNLETGQSATVDAPLALELIARAATAVNPAAAAVLDIGCGAGNYTLKLMQHLPIRSATLVDLSRPMLDRAVERIRAAGDIETTAIHGDIRDTPLPAERFDVAVAAATLHHLRGDAEWELVFGAVHQALKPGGSFWVFDLVSHDPPAVQQLMWERYGEYLAGFKGPAYRDRVFAYVEAEDSPRPLAWQLALLARTGYQYVEVLHKSACFAAFGATK